jgi:hypothetical protein
VACLGAKAPANRDSHAIDEVTSAEPSGNGLGPDFGVEKKLPN